MKKLWMAFLLGLPLTSLTQTFIIKVDDFVSKTNEIAPEINFKSAIKKFLIKTENAAASPKTFAAKLGDENVRFNTDGAFHEVQFSTDIRDKSISIHDNTDAFITSFVLTAASEQKEEEEGEKTTVQLPQLSATGYLSSLFVGMLRVVDEVGLRLSVGAKNNSAYTGDRYIHLFFDQNGNTLFRSIPVGIGRANYVVHVAYLVPKDNPLIIDYKVNQSAADIEEGVVIRGDGSLNTNLVLQGREKNKVQEFEWKHYEIALTPSSADIQFDIIRNSYEIKNGQLELKEPRLIATRTIKMKRIYHGSIDVGILETQLENPVFSLANSDKDPNQKVVKRTNEGRRTFASAMYTFYISPVVLLEKLIAPSRVRNYRVEGRNFVSDHKIYERIYPTFGIGLNDRLLDNIFLGGKWEFIRGGALFVGYHKGKVNTFEVDAQFEFSETFISQNAFDLKTKTAWKGNFCIGLNLDIRIITNLFQRGGAAANND